MIAAAQFTISDLNDAVNEVIVGTQTAATASWTGVASTFTELRDGQQIIYWLPYAGASNVTLNLTLPGGATTGAIPVYYSGTTRVSTHYAAGNAIRMIYKVNAPISGSLYTGWWADANYDSGNTYDRIRLNNQVTAKSAISASHLIVGDQQGYFHLTASAVFSVNYPILYTTNAIASGATGTTGYLCYPGINLRTTVGNNSWTATKGKTCYIAGTLSGETFTVAASGWLTTEPADTTGNVVYISLGIMYSAYQLYLYPEHPMFRRINGVLTAVSQIAYEAKVSIDTLELGGRNYILKSGAEAESEASLVWTYDVSTPLEAGQEYTVSLSVSPASGVTALELWLSGGYAKQCEMAVSGTGKQTVSCTFTAFYASGKTPDNAPENASVRVCRLPAPQSGASVGKTRIHWIKVEKGNRATDYAAAPEDAEETLEVKLASVYARIATESDSIRHEVSATYAATSDVNVIRQQLSTFTEQTQNSMTWAVTRINQLQEDMTQGQEATEEQLQLLQTYMTFTDSGLVIGKTGNPFTFRVVNDRLSFYMNDTEVAYLSNNKLFITQSEVLSRLQIGVFAFEPQANGNLSIVYTG